MRCDSDLNEITSFPFPEYKVSTEIILTHSTFISVAISLKMFQKIKIFQACIILGLCMSVLGNLTNHATRPKGERSAGNLHYMGKVPVTTKDKHYHASTYRVPIGNWTDAKAICAAEAMTLATIEDVDDLEFLVGRFEKEVFDGWYWLGGRDSHTVTQLVWDKDTSALPDATVIGLPQFGIGYGEIERNQFQTCLGYISDENIRKRGIALFRCDYGQSLVLCECIHATRCGPNKETRNKSI